MNHSGKEELNGNHREEAKVLLFFPTNHLLSLARIQANGGVRAEGCKDQSGTVGSSQVFQWENHFDLLHTDDNFGQATMGRT